MKTSYYFREDCAVRLSETVGVMAAAERYGMRYQTVYDRRSQRLGFKAPAFSDVLHPTWGTPVMPDCDRLFILVQAEILGTVEAAERYHLSQHTLRSWRSKAYRGFYGTPFRTRLLRAQAGQVLDWVTPVVTEVEHEALAA